jgi:hypothetical protein
MCVGIGCHLAFHGDRHTRLFVYDFVLRILHQNTLLITSMLLIFRFLDELSVTYIASGLIKEGTVVYTHLKVRGRI